MELPVLEKNRISIGGLKICLEEDIDIIFAKVASLPDQSLKIHQSNNLGIITITAEKQPELIFSPGANRMSINALFIKYAQKMPLRKAINYYGEPTRCIIEYHDTDAEVAIFSPKLVTRPDGRENFDCLEFFSQQYIMESSCPLSQKIREIYGLNGQIWQ